LAEGAHDEDSQVADADISAQFQVDLRYSGQGLVLTVDTSAREIRESGFSVISAQFDRLHEQLFTFALDAQKEFVNLRAVVQGPETHIAATELGAGDSGVEEAVVGDHTIFSEGREHSAKLYERAKLHPGHVIQGPAVIMEMDSTTLVLPDHHATVDRIGNLLINPLGNDALEKITDR
jgi:N-methylhydantoinase A